MKALALTALLLLAAGSASAQTFLFTGHLDDGAAPASGTFTVGLRIEDGAEVLWEEVQAGVVVVDGVFAVDAGAVEPITVLPPVDARLVVTVDGDELPPLPLARLLAVNSADRAERALLARAADRVTGLAENDVVTRARLGAAGQAPVPFNALTGVPAGVSDGDDGADLGVLAGGGLTLTARTLALASSVDGRKLAVGSVAGSALEANTIGNNNAKVAAGAITGAKVRDGSLTGGDLANAVTVAEVAGRKVFQVSAAGCSDIGILTTSATCSRRTCQAGPVAGRITCDTGECTAFILGQSTTCPNDELGFLVAP